MGFAYLQNVYLHWRWGEIDRTRARYPCEQSVASVTSFVERVAGHFITQIQWPVGATVPAIGFSIQRLSNPVGLIQVSNITAIPGHFRLSPVAPITATATDFQVGYEPAKVLDTDPATFWHSKYSPDLKQFPHTITIDLGGLFLVSYLSYTPRKDGGNNGHIGLHDVQLSTDAQNWLYGMYQTTWPDYNTSMTDSWTPTEARYVRLTAHSEAGNRGPFTSASTLQVGYTGLSTESASDIDFSGPWAKKHVYIANQSGTLNDPGLTMDGQAHPNSVNNPWIYQQQVPDYDQSLSVFNLDIPASYTFTGPRGVPFIADVKFAGLNFAPNTGRWVDWNGDTLTDIAAANLAVGQGAQGGQKTNTVFCVNGQNCATVFANGVFQFSVTERTGAGGKKMSIETCYLPELSSWWTDVVWHKMRCAPPLKPAS